jgi:sarcosine oxidase subunit beta
MVSRAGLYDVSPDDHAIIGPVPEVEGFYCANGFSGHGFQHSPATGRVLADLLLDGRVSGLDISPASRAVLSSASPAEPLERLPTHLRVGLPDP